MNIEEREISFLLGAIFGTFLVCMLRAMRCILSGKLKAEDNIEGYPGIAGLGCTEENAKEQKLKIIASNISLYCEKGDMKHIYLNSSVNCTQEKTAELVQLLTEKGIEVKEGFSILRDAKAMEDMSRADGIVFFEQAGKSCYEDLEREIKLCREDGKTVIGMIVLV